MHRVVDIATRYGTMGDLDFANVAVWNPKIFQQIPPQQKFHSFQLLRIG